ncbi:MAG: hypothetical protein KY475_25820 [Planctomycetes bacterium]|nr:hypothetical protein [Planctomycetota bacterium]
MAKFYVESNSLRVIVDGAAPVPAAALAVSQAVARHVELAEIVTVSERGFVSEREGGWLYDTDLMLETGTLLGMLAEHEMN